MQPLDVLNLWTSFSEPLLPFVVAHFGVKYGLQVAGFVVELIREATNEPKFDS